MMNISDLRIKISTDGGAYMNEGQMALYEAHLRSLLRQAQEALHHEQALCDDHQRLTESVDIATQNASKATREASRLKRIERIRQIQRALEAIKEEEYGFCAQCGEEIGHARLLAVPHSLMDTECASQQEQHPVKALGR